MLCPQYFSQQILYGRLLLVVISGQQINLNFKLKLKPKTTSQLGYVIKKLWT